MTDILINGEEKSTVSIHDRGLLYGDGLFETMAVRNKNIHLWEEHWQRLVLGCAKLSISTPDKNTLENEIALLCDNKNESKFIIKLIITRGEGSRGYLFQGEQKVTRILSCHSWPNYPKQYQLQGVAVRYCDTALSENEKLAEIKHLNRLEQVLARNEWDTNNFQEGLMLTSKGHVVDGTMSNIFVVKDSKIFTPALSMCGVAGVMRKTVIKLANQLNIEVSEQVLTKTELKMADELFLTNSLFGIWPVQSIEKTRYTKNGKITKKLQDEISKLGY